MIVPAELGGFLSTQAFVRYQDAEMDLPDKPPGMHWSSYNRLAERLERQCNVASY